MTETYINSGTVKLWTRVDDEGLPLLFVGKHSRGRFSPDECPGIPGTGEGQNDIRPAWAVEQIAYLLPSQRRLS